MNKGNENELDDLNQRKDSEESNSSVELGDYSQLLTEDNEPTVSDNSETVGFEDENVPHNTYVSDEEGFGTDDSEENMHQINTEQTPMLRSENNNKKSNKKMILIGVSILLLIAVGFILVKKPFVNDNTKNMPTSTSFFENESDEAAAESIMKRFLDFYEDRAQGEILKDDISLEEVEKIKADIDNVKNETVRDQFLDMYYKLQNDILEKSAKDNSTNYEKVSNSTGS